MGLKSTELLVTARVCWQPLYSQSYHVTLVVDGVPRHHSWVELLAASLLGSLPWHLLVPLRLVLKEEMWITVPGQEPLGLVSEVHSNRDLWWEMPISCKSWKSFGQQLKRILMSGIGAFG